MLTFPRLLPRVLLAASLASLTWCPATAQQFVPYSQFQALTPTQILDLSLKLTYVGSQLAPVQTRMLQARPSGSASQFAALRRPALSCGRDTLVVALTYVTTSEFDAVLDSVATLPGVIDGGVDGGGLLSFAPRDTAGGVRGSESVLDAANARAPFSRMRGALEATLSHVSRSTRWRATSTCCPSRRRLTSPDRCWWRWAGCIWLGPTAAAWPRP